MDVIEAVKQQICAPSRITSAYIPTLPSGTHVIPHRETRLMLNDDGSVWKWPTRVINGELIEVDLKGNPRIKL